MTSNGHYGGAQRPSLGGDHPDLAPGDGVDDGQILIQPVGVFKFLPVAILSALALLAFTAPWLSYEPGHRTDRPQTYLSLGGKITAEDLPMSALQDQVWGLAFAGVCLAFALWIASQWTVSNAGIVAILAGCALFLLVLATWLGRSVWSKVPMDDPSMAWGYWVSLALTLVLFYGGVALIMLEADD